MFTVPGRSRRAASIRSGATWAASAIATGEPRVFHRKVRSSVCQISGILGHIHSKPHRLHTIVFGLSEPGASGVRAAVESERSKLVLQHDQPLGMAFNTSPVPRERFLCPLDSQISPNRLDGQEQRFHGSMIFHVAEMRGHRGTRLVQRLFLDSDQWLLGSLMSGDSEMPALARFRGNVKPGPKQAGLMAYYDRAGWYIAGTLEIYTRV
jgi:hypothetical protein